jgi:hypothetical protein
MEIDWGLFNKTVSDMVNWVLNLPGFESLLIAAGLLAIVAGAIWAVIRWIRNRS